MADIALYYPYASFSSDAWVKAAALHWPQIGRIRPSGIRPSVMRPDTDTVERLQEELDFVIDLDPGITGRMWASSATLERVDRLGLYAGGETYGHWDVIEDQVGAIFYDFLYQHREELVRRYGVGHLGIVPSAISKVYDTPPPIDPRLEIISPSKMLGGLQADLVEYGLLVRIAYSWRGSDHRVRSHHENAMHRDLATVYLAILADVVACENQMTPVSDQATLAIASAGGWTAEAMARILLDDEPTADEIGESQEVFALLALHTVVPKGLADVPVSRIIEARRRLLPELMEYRRFLDTLTPEIARICQIRDPDVRAAAFRNEVEVRVAQPIARMEAEIGRLGMKPVRALMTMQTLAPPAVLGLLADAANIPPSITGFGVAAGCLVGASVSATDQRRKVLGSHPAGYLLSIRGELKPSDTVARLRSIVRRTGSARKI